MEVPSSLAVIFIALAGITLTQALSEVLLRNDLEVCKEEHNVTEADLERMKNKEVPETPEGKCFLECMMNKVDLMSGNRLNSQGAKGMIAEIEGISDDEKAKLTAVIDECNQEIQHKEDEDCENSLIISKCISEKAAKKGIQAPGEG